ncbi:MAG: hypothetical protein DRP85_02115 [Candidatus Makaraimicrobium thalassicum]|nr:MAG: hypothetical protein DRP85_02115 [Candidatus Omnitrophota bacterium]
MSEYICPHCGKPIYDDEALLCLYCGENLERGVGLLGRIKYSPHWLIIAAVVIVVLVAFIVLMSR